MRIFIEYFLVSRWNGFLGVCWSFFFQALGDKIVYGLPKISKLRPPPLVGSWEYHMVIAEGVKSVRWPWPTFSLKWMRKCRQRLSIKPAPYVYIAESVSWAFWAPETSTATSRIAKLQDSLSFFFAVSHWSPSCGLIFKRGRLCAHCWEGRKLCRVLWRRDSLED